MYCFFPIILQVRQLLLVYLKGGLFHRVEYVNWARCFGWPDFAQRRSKSSHFPFLSKLLVALPRRRMKCLRLQGKTNLTPTSDVILLCGSVCSAHDIFERC